MCECSGGSHCNGTGLWPTEGGWGQHLHCVSCYMYLCPGSHHSHDMSLLLQVQEMYFAKPPVSPGLDFYKDVIKTLVKYNDRWIGGTNHPVAIWSPVLPFEGYSLSFHHHNHPSHTHIHTHKLIHIHTHTHAHILRVGVETLWNFMSEMNVEPDAELVALVSSTC